MHLAKILVKENILSLDQIKAAIEEQRRTGKGLGEALIGLGYINEDQLVDFLSREYGVPAVNLDEFEIETVVLKLVPRKTVLEHNVIPIGRSGTTLVVAMSDPSNIIAVDDLRFATGYNIKPVVAPERAIRNAIEKHYGIDEGKERVRGERNEGSTEEMIRELEDFKKTVGEPDETELSEGFDSVPPQEEITPESVQEKEDISTSGLFSQGYESEQKQEETSPNLMEGEDRPEEIESVEQREEASLELEQDEEVFKLFGIPSSSQGFESAKSKEEISTESEPKETVFKESVSPLSQEDETLRKHESGSEILQEGVSKPSDLFSQVYETEQKEEISKESFVPSHEPMWQEEKQRDEEQAVILHKEITVSTLSEPKEEKEGDFKGTLLVVDDSPTVRRIVSITMERRGYRVFTAADPMQALAKLNEVVPDLILLDINLPHMDGYRLCKFIKDNSLTKDIPVVMLSGKDGFFDRVRGRIAGAADYIAKPFEPSTLIQMVEKYSRLDN